MFPSEAKRVQKGISADLERWNRALAIPPEARNPDDLADYAPPFGLHGDTPPKWVLSSVTTFQVRYSPPVPGLTVDHSIEALVEGSEMSKLTKREHLVCG